MSNMSYCRFQNTLGDLQECYYDLVENDFNIDHLSEEERAAASHMLAVCRRIVELHDEKYEN